MNELETWRPVLDHEGWYSVSSIGRVCSEDRHFVRHNGNPLTVPGIIHKTKIGNTGAGYRMVTLCTNGRRKTRPVHQLVCEAFHGPRPDGMLVRHLDGDSLNNCADNLAWGTPSENMLDRARHGTNPQSNTTHCPRGHLLEAPNLSEAQLRKGMRECLACSRAHCRVRYHRLKGIEINFQHLSDRYHDAIVNPYPSKPFTRRRAS